MYKQVHTYYAIAYVGTVCIFAYHILYYTLHITQYMTCRLPYIIRHTHYMFHAVYSSCIITRAGNCNVIYEVLHAIKHAWCIELVWHVTRHNAW